MATTSTDTNVSQLVINKMTKAEYEALQTKSDTELYLIPESVDSSPTQNSTNPVQSGGVYTALAGVHQVPSGGNAGQVLKKSSATDYDYAWANQTQDYPSAYCTTSAGTAAKKASCSLYAAQANSYLHVLIGAANTSAGAITLNVNSAGAKPIYINGEASSSTNYTLPAGSYIVFYDGTNYYFRTDGKIQASATTVLANTSEVGGKEDKIAIDSTAKTASFTAAVKNYYFVNIAASGSITVTLTTPTDNSHLQNAVFRVTTSTSPQLIFAAASGIDVYKATNYKIEADKIYEVNAQWNGVNWDIANVELEAQS